MATRAWVDRLRTDALELPLGTDTARPELSWRIGSTERGARPTAYQVRMATTLDALGAKGGLDMLVSGRNLWWDSGRVASGDVRTTYAGPELRSRTRYHWQVRVWTTVEGTSGAQGKPAERASAWSEPAWFETAFLHADAWTAHWIGDPGDPPEDEPTPAAYLRRGFELPEGDRVVRARAYASALGWYRLHVNGTNVTGDEQVPRWTSFDHRVEYQTYDVTEHLRAGDNTVGLVVADGRFRGLLGLLRRRRVYGDHPAALVQLEVDLASGRRITVRSDGTWDAGRGPITAADPMDGESYDARFEVPGWDEPGAAPTGFVPARLHAGERRRLVARSCPPVRAIETLAPARVFRSPAGRTVVDLGENIAGVLRIRLSGRRGQTVTLTHAEVLDTAGEVTLKPLAVGRDGVRQTDTYTLAGDGPEVYQPAFTIHGFRYVQVDGLTAPLAPEDVTGVVLSSDLRQVGEFTASDRRLETLHRNVVRTLRGNLLDTHEDCPTRERSGFTGDTQVFAPTATLLVEALPFLRHWLADLALDQFPDGRLPVVVPGEYSERAGTTNRLNMFRGSAGWDDAAVLVPWTLYERYADVEVLRRQYPSMVAQVDAVVRRAAGRRSTWRLLGGVRRGRQLSEVVDGMRREPHERYVVDTGLHFGEWLEPGTSPATTLPRMIAKAPADVATAYLAYTSGVLARIAELLGYADDAARYAEVAAGARHAWQREFARSDGTVVPDRQATYVRALMFDLVPAELRPAVGARLAELVEEADRHLETGFLATPLLLDALVAAGRLDLAYDVLLRDTPPSWLHQVAQGATTTWETWEGRGRDGEPAGSHNHVAFGAVVRWLYETVAGLGSAAPGFRRLRLAPRPGGGLDHASARTETPYGPAACGWAHGDGGAIRVEVEVPVGATAEVVLPGAGAHTVYERGVDVAEVPDVRVTGRADGDLLLSVGSGRYTFSWAADRGW